MNSFDSSELSQIRQQESQSQCQPSSKDCLAQIFQLEHLSQYMYFSMKNARPKLRQISQQIRVKYPYPLEYSIATKSSMQDKGSAFTRIFEKVQKQFDSQPKNRKYLTTEQIKQLIKSKVTSPRKSSSSKSQNISHPNSVSKLSHQKYLSTLQLKVKQRIQSTKKVEVTKQIDDPKQNNQINEYLKKIDDATLEGDRIKEEIYVSEGTEQIKRLIKQMKINHQERKCFLQKILQILSSKGGLPWLTDFSQQNERSGVSKEDEYSKFEKYFYSIYLDQRQIFLIEAQNQAND